MMNKKKLVTLGTLAVIVGTLFVSRPAYAAEKGGFWGGNFFSGLVTFISQKFGLDKTQVQNAVQDYKKQTMATITPRPTMSPESKQTAEKKRLDTLVSQGKITTDQENAIIAELEAVQAKYKLDASAAPEQRKTQMQSIQSELKSWATSQGIDISYLMMGGNGRGMGGGMRGNRTPKPTVTP